MRTTVAMVEAHPESIAEDYRRVLALAKLSPAVVGQPLTVAMGTDQQEFRPGWSATPWQLDATLAWLGPLGDKLQVVAVDRRGASPLPVAALWQDSLDRHGAQTAAAGFWPEHRLSSELLHPALDSVLAEGVMAPVGFAESPVLLLAAPAVREVWGVGGSCALLHALLVGEAGTGRHLSVKRRAPVSEIIAESIGLALEMIPHCGAVIDGTVWGVTAADGRRDCVARNIVLAGSDPVAVDAVAARLAGLDPQRVPWLRVCHERGFGQVLPSEINLVGRKELLGLDFDLRTGTLAAPDSSARATWAGPWSRLTQRVSRRPSVALQDTAWEKLGAAYIEGSESPSMTHAKGIR